MIAFTGVSRAGPDGAASTHTLRAVVVLCVVEVTLSIGAAEPLQLGPQPAPQQAVVVRKVHQRVIVHLVARHPVSHGNTLQDKDKFGASSYNCRIIIYDINVSVVASKLHIITVF